jgi:hypothetical protein
MTSRHDTTNGTTRAYLLLLDLALQQMGGDCDLYIQKNAYPTRSRLISLTFAFARVVVCVRCVCVCARARAWPESVGAQSRLTVMSFSYLQHDLSTERNATIVTDAAPGKWYIGIYGFAACSFQLTAHVSGTYTTRHAARHDTHSSS